MTRGTAKSRTDAPKMTAHHFEYLAYVLRQLPAYPTGIDDNQLQSLASVISGFLKHTNPRFDTDVFVDNVLNG